MRNNSAVLGTTSTLMGHSASRVERSRSSQMATLGLDLIEAAELGIARDSHHSTLNVNVCDNPR